MVTTLSSGLELESISISANYTMTKFDIVILVDTTNTAITVTLLDPSTVLERVVYIVDSTGHANTNKITISGTVNGGTNATISTQRESLALIATSASWVIISEYP